MSDQPPPPRSPKDSFVHLHVHTEYSMLDGAARIDELLASAAQMGMPAVATTDHGYVFGAYEFWSKAKKYDVKPIIGVEAYLTPGTHRTDRTRVKFGDGGRDDVGGSGAYTHMTLLARNNTGMHNLFRMSSLASLEGHYFKPRIDRELLSLYGEGLIATTGCVGGEVQTRLRMGQYQQAREAAAEMRDIFGAENFYAELMDHGIPIERQTQKELLRLAKDLGLPLLATNDLHYTNAADAQAHAALLCVQSGSTLMDPDRFTFDSEEFYLKTPAQMRELFRELPEACDNTLRIAERCEVSFTEGEGRYMPRFPCPPGEDETSWFVKEVERGLRERFPQGVPEYASKQAAYETDVIAGKGYCFPADTPVLMADGTWRAISQVTEQDAVTSVSQKDLLGRVSQVQKVLTREVDEDLCVIRPFGQVFPIRATKEHPFLVAHRGWVEAQDVRAGDEVLLVQPVRAPYEPFDVLTMMEENGWTVVDAPDGRVSRLGRGDRRAPRACAGSLPDKLEWSEDLMWLLGLWVAEGHLYDPDGSVNPGQIGWTLHRDEPAVQRLCHVIECLGLGRARLYSKVSGDQPDHQGVVVGLTNHPLALFLRQVFGTGVRGKRVGGWVRSVPDEALSAFVAGWLEGDGHVHEDRGRNVVVTVSDVLARDLRTILLSLGRWATVQHSPSQRSFKVLWQESSRKKPYNAQFIDGRWWVRVRSTTTERYTGTVYNLTVAGDHTYVAEGVAVHNCGYFLIVADFINWAKDNGIRVGPGRGSGAGSMCAYAMKITDLDPVPHGLIFERFLNPERPSMPDFDVDFDERRRGEVIRYVTDTYGEDRVAQIVTYGTIKAKQAVKDAARVMGHPFAMGERLTKAMPADVMGKGVPLSGIFDAEHPRYGDGAEFRALHEQDPQAQEVVATARGLEGLKRQWGVHAAGVIMSSEPLVDLVPIMRREQDGQIITQFDYPSCEALGLVKMDFLGLRNLTILDDAIDNIQANRGEVIDLDVLSKDMTDAKAYELLQRGDTLGVFQLDGGGMRTLLRQMQPDNFEDISAALALYRPGPMGANSHTNYALRKTGKQPITPIHPELAEPLAEILDVSQGLIIYQEQVQQIAQRVAGYTLGKADMLRRAMGKKKKEVLEAEFVPFRDGMKANGFSDAAIKTLWDILVPFSDYAFNKAHTAAYGLVSYWTAYLKANYPAEYMAALLTSVQDDKDKSALYLNECRRMGIRVLLPDVNDSVARFAAVGPDIRFGLEAIRNVGHNVVSAIIAAREAPGASGGGAPAPGASGGGAPAPGASGGGAPAPGASGGGAPAQNGASGAVANAQRNRFTSFKDFLAKCPAVVANKRTIESLIKAGAFDSLGETRSGLLRVHDEYVDAFVAIKRQEAIGQDSLFGGLGADGGSGLEDGVMGLSPVPTAEWDKATLLTNERAMLGLYVSDHPLFGIEHILTKAADHSVAHVSSEEGPADGANVTIAGLVTGLVIKRNKKGELYAVATVEDLEGAVECFFFPKTYLTVQGLLTQDVVVVVRGRVSRRDEGVSLYASEMTLPDTSEGPRGPVVLVMEQSRATMPRISALKGVLSAHPGSTEVRLRLTRPGRTMLMTLDRTYSVTASEALFGDLKALLGPRCLAGC